MHVVILNTVVLNCGDAAILKAEIEILRRVFGTDVELTVYDSHPAVAGRHYPCIRFRRSPYWDLAQSSGDSSYKIGPVHLVRFSAAFRLHRTGLRRLSLRLAKDHAQFVEDLASADLIISTGGTYLVEQYDLDERIFLLRAAVASGRPLVFYTQSLGPFRKPSNRRSLRRVLAYADLILVRDIESRSSVQDLGVRTATHVVADAAFGLLEPNSFRRPPPQSWSPKRVALSVRSWPYFERFSPEEGMKRYTASVRGLVAYLTQTYGSEITFISSCQGVPDYHDDSKLASNIVKALPPAVAAKVVLDRSFNTPSRLAEKLSAFDMVVATRMHVAILALTRGIPVFPIAYEFKTRALFEQLGFPQWVQDIEDLDPSLLRQALESWINGLPACRDALFDAVESQYTSAVSVATLLAQLH
ncbi:MAG TPA: polysaccharide pyruvyl transferase family protein [Thermoanaerobaculia bacterium]|nr:polysaccharide pyruvyl transferase family protein [Thermoanaerobaculia bacterium]